MTSFHMCQITVQLGHAVLKTPPTLECTIIMAGITLSYAFLVTPQT